MTANCRCNIASQELVGRIKIDLNRQIQTATISVADQKPYLANATDNSVHIVDARIKAVESVGNVGLFPWGTYIMDSKDNYCH